MIESLVCKNVRTVYYFKLFFIPLKTNQQLSFFLPALFIHFKSLVEKSCAIEF